MVSALALLYFAQAKSAMACASCGSGGEDPLILYPNESLKVYTGFTRAGAFKDISAQGVSQSSFGPEEKTTATLSVGALVTFIPALSNKAFVTATVPFIANTAEGATKSGLGDPSFQARYTALMQTMAEPIIPQVQLIAGYKPTLTRSNLDTSVPHQLDVMGNGYNELKGGADIWFGMTDLKIGAAMVGVKSLARQTEGGLDELGFGLRSTLSIGYGFGDAAKLTGGVNRETHELRRIDNELMKDSADATTGVFLTADAMLSASTTIRLSMVRRGYYGENYNTTRSQALTIAVMASL